MDHIITLAAACAFVYILWRRHKKKAAGTGSHEAGTKTCSVKDAELLEVLEILIAKLEILITRQKEEKDGTDGSP